MSAFSVGIASLFADPNMAEDATYTPAATGVPATVRVIHTAPDEDTPWGEARLHSATVQLEIPISAVAQPVAEDVITWRGEARKVQGAPERDVERLTWLLDTRPA